MIVVGDTLYILAGRDVARPNVNDFIMPEWELFTTKDVASKQWQFYPGILRPEQIFTWAAPGHAYAGQIVQGKDKRFYLYAPVEEAHSHNADPFAIGVAVADSVLGPWKDAHPGGPVISQSVPELNHVQNIDPTVLVDRDGRVYMYWGTFGRLRGIELDPIWSPQRATSSASRRLRVSLRPRASSAAATHTICSMRTIRLAGTHRARRRSIMRA
jgi:hypothetical protein